MTVAPSREFSRRPEKPLSTEVVEPKAKRNWFVAIVLVALAVVVRAALRPRPARAASDESGDSSFFGVGWSSDGGGDGD